MSAVLAMRPRQPTEEKVRAQVRDQMRAKAVRSIRFHTRFLAQMRRRDATHEFDYIRRDLPTQAHVQTTAWGALSMALTLGLIIDAEEERFRARIELICRAHVTHPPRPKRREALPT